MKKPKCIVSLETATPLQAIPVKYRHAKAGGPAKTGWDIVIPNPHIELNTGYMLAGHGGKDLVRLAEISPGVGRGAKWYVRCHDVDGIGRYSGLTVTGTSQYTDRIDKAMEVVAEHFRQVVAAQVIALISNK